MATTYTVTNDFTGGTTAVADQVDANFTDILTAINAFDAGNLASGTVALARISGLTSTQCAAAFFKDEDAMTSDSATAVSSQQALKAYVDSIVGITYRYLPIDTVSTKVYTKYLTGTTDSDATTEVAHGVTAANILHVSACINYAGGATYYVADFQKAASGDCFAFGYNATNIVIAGIGANFQGQAYRIRIDYT